MIKVAVSCVILLITLFTPVFAQSVLSGTIQEEKSGEPIAFANVVLYIGDSLLLTGSSSDEKGEFKLKSIAAGIYVLQVSCLGFQTLRITLPVEKKNLELGVLKLAKMSQALEDVTVVGKPVRKYDREIIFPSSSQVKYATNGLTLLYNLKLLRLTIDLAKNTTTTFDGGEVGFCINGKPVTETEILAIRPEEVLRIEYHDRPGLRYGSKAAVVDYILKTIEQGGMLAVDLTDAPFDSNGQNLLIGNYHHNKSEIGFTYNYSFLATDFRWFELSRYAFADGSEIKRDKISRETKVRSQDHRFMLYYANRVKDKYHFNVSLREKIYRIPDYNRASDLFTESNSSATIVTDKEGTYSSVPSLELYFERNLPSSQTLIFNAVGTYFKNRYHQYYQYEEEGLTTAAGGSAVKGEKYSWIGEGYYEKKWEKLTLITGLKNSWSTTSNRYFTEGEEKITLKNNISEALVQCTGMHGQWQYMIGGGIENQYFSEEEVSYFRWSYKFLSGFKYQLNEESYLGYSGNIYRQYPGLGSLNNVSQSLNDLLIQSGNRDLKSWMNYSTTWAYAYTANRYNGYIQASYSYNHAPVMGETFRVNDRFVRREDNQKGLHQVAFFLGGRFDLWKERLSLDFTPVWSYTVSQGNTYTHRHSLIYYKLGLTAMYKNWLMVFQVNNEYTALSGEMIDYGNKTDQLMCMYKYKRFAFSIGVSDFLGRDYRSNQEKNCSSLAFSHQYTEGKSNKFFFKLSYTLPFGKPAESQTQKINNQDTDDGILK